MALAAVVSSSEPRSLRELLSCSPDELSDVDIARANLLCAEGLPGAEDLDVDRYLAILLLWAKRVEAMTNRHLAVFRANPSKYNNSEAFWRTLALTTVLRNEFHVRYNMERIEHEDWSDSRDFLIHGLLASKRAGTCTSLPVLVVALGRRLGYPLYLVHTLGHLFLRWEDADGQERFNVEFNGDGMLCHSDQYYREWPAQWTAEIAALEVQRGEKRAFLRNLTPGEEVAHGLCMRGHCLEAVGRWEEGVEAYEASARFGPFHPAPPVYARHLKNKIRSADVLLEQVRATTPNFDPNLPAVLGVQTMRGPQGVKIALSYQQRSEPIAPFDPSFRPPPGISPALLCIRNVVNQVDAQHHPLAGFQPATPPKNL